ncbi:hypothetical protein KGV31_002147 [Vibrio parahaemolyticus]|nr:hypothetical protein [Vibrio parahaemolyticus]
MRDTSYKARAKIAHAEVFSNDRARFAIWLQLKRPCYEGFKAFCRDHDIAIASLEQIENYKDAYIYGTQN